MKAALSNIWLYRIARWAIAAFFLVAAAMKLTDMGAFAETIGAFGILPDWGLMPGAWGLVAAEIVGAVLLAFDLRGGLEAITALLVTFSAVLLYGMTIGLDVDCGCLGPGEAGEEGLLTPLLRDIVMLAECGYLFWWKIVAKETKT